jgi:uncharacterized membrane protein
MSLTIALAVHIASVVLWIGGVAMVATVLLPAVRRFKSPVEQAQFFALIEGRFAAQARWTTALAGASGFYMVDQMGMWDRLRAFDLWWLDAMAALWLIFTIILFVAEPLFLDRWFQERAAVAPEATFALIQRLHWAFLALGLATITAAVLGSHGVSL